MKNVMQSGRDVTLTVRKTAHGDWMGELTGRDGQSTEITGCASPQAVEQAARDKGFDIHRRELDGQRLDDEIQTLDKANADIEAGQERIERQERLTEELDRDGHDTSTALAVLGTLKETQQVMLDHRRVILEQIERLSSATTARNLPKT